MNRLLRFLSIPEVKKLAAISRSYGCGQGAITLIDMKLLAFETATEACSVAVWVDGEVHERFELAARRHAELALPWAEQLLAEAGVARAQLDAIAVGRGPGAFTGVRLAIALAQGIALALDRPVVPVSTLAALAASAPPPATAGGGWEGVVWNQAAAEARATPPQPSPAFAGEGAKQHILAAIDARMGEVYAGAFERRGEALIALSDETVGAPDAVELPAIEPPAGDGGWHGVGTGFAAADAVLHAHLRGQLRSVDANALPHAADVARLGAAAFARGEGVAPERLEPAYLRNHVALTVREQQALRDSR